jgi:hypothetical protein
MLKSLLFIIIICAIALPAFCKPSAKYEVATILDVKPHQSAGGSSLSMAASYEVSVKVSGTIYPGSAHRYIGHKHSEVCGRQRTPGARRKEHHHLQRRFGPIARSADHQPEAGHNCEPVEVIAEVL